MTAKTNAPAGLTIRSAADADWPAMEWLAAVCFGSLRVPETTATWRSMIPDGGAVVACDGAELVGVAFYLDLKLTVPGGAVLPTAGVTWVVVAPTHRRRGVLRAMFADLHGRMVVGSYPLAALEASEGGIYGRFGYGPATVDHQLSIDRRWARFHPQVPDPGGVRMVRPQDHRERLEDLYERWRLRTPGGLYSPPALWDEVLADREGTRDGGSAFMALLHADGFAMYRLHTGDKGYSVEVTIFVGLTDDAHAALWRVLLGMDLMETVTVHTHPADPLPYLLTDSRLARVVGVQDALWLRILDVPGVLEARTYGADLTVVLDCSDDVLGGGGRFALQIRDGRARCERTEAEPTVYTDLSVLGSLYLGAHRASAFASANRLRCNDSAIIAQLDAAFASEVPAEIGYDF